MREHDLIRAHERGEDHPDIDMLFDGPVLIDGLEPRERASGYCLKLRPYRRCGKLLGKEKPHAPRVVDEGAQDSEDEEQPLAGRRRAQGLLRRHATACVQHDLRRNALP